MRNRLETIFSIDNVKSMIPLIDANIRVLMSNLETVAINGNPVDMKKYFTALNLDVISNCIFGTEINALQNVNEEFVKYTKKIFSRNEALLKVINMFLPTLSAIDSNVWNPLFSYIEQIVKHRIKSDVKRLDLLQLLLDCVSNGNQKANIVTNVADQLMLLLVEGFETTTTALSVAAYCLAYYSDFQEKVVEEIDEKDDGSTDDYKTVNRLNYLNAFVCEVLRMYPTVPRFVIYAFL
ncbi:cytochrome P450 3A6-like protein [Leptotrombidium deliense]|uniref:Cytochrome P450 3A6-like protein n=1 Tax=Leptotrombidium deliense TaxID=299467 RepID=A0A443SR80_9ACAR|nr:cytochrome P450 3A6-like protein [Leptotrombidium deliense]